MKYIFTIIFSLALALPVFASTTETGWVNITTGQGSNAGSVSTGLGGVTLLQPPTGIVATKNGNKDITIIWDSVATADGYSLYRIKNSVPAVFVASTTNNTYTDANLADGKYSYQVQSYYKKLITRKSIPTFPIIIGTAVVTTNTGGNGGGNTGGGGSISNTSTPSILGDFNGDGKVDILDFNTLIIHWGMTSGATKADGDANGDGKVNILDFNILITHWTN